MRDLVNEPGREAHPLNPVAWRGADGIWGSDELPVRPWEAADARVVVPRDIQQELGIPNAVLRWKVTKRAGVLRNHPEVAPHLESIPDLMRQAQYRAYDTRIGRELGYVFVYSDGTTRLKLVIGEYQDGFWNVVTIYGPRNARDIRRWQREFGIS